MGAELKRKQVTWECKFYQFQVFIYDKGSPSIDELKQQNVKMYMSNVTHSVLYMYVHVTRSAYELK